MVEAGGAPVGFMAPTEDDRAVDAEGNEPGLAVGGSVIFAFDESMDGIIILEDEVVIFSTEGPPVVETPTFGS